MTEPTPPPHQTIQSFFKKRGKNIKRINISCKKINVVGHKKKTDKARSLEEHNSKNHRIYIPSSISPTKKLKVRWQHQVH
jgi:predicted transcriptional regulator